MGNWVARDREARQGSDGLSASDVDGAGTGSGPRSRTLRMERDVLKRSVVLCGEGSDPRSSVARLVADQRTSYRGAARADLWAAGREPVVVLQVAGPAAHAAAAAVEPTWTPPWPVMFDDAKGLHGSPRLHVDLRASAGSAPTR